MNYWKKPLLDRIDERISLNFFTPFQTTLFTNRFDSMANSWQGHAFGNGPMTASSVDNSWNTDAGASSWNEDTVYNGGFGNVPSADKNGDNPAESSGRASLPGGCFNCGEGKFEV